MESNYEYRLPLTGRNWIPFLFCKRFVDAHNVDRGVLVSVHETVTSIAVSILTSQYTMNLLRLLQNYVLIQCFENAGEDRTTLAATL